MNTVSRLPRVMVFDDQAIYGPLYSAIFGSDGVFELVGVEAGKGGRSMTDVLAHVDTDVVVAGVKGFSAEVGKELSEYKRRCPSNGVVVLLAFMDDEGAQCLRKFLLQCKSGVALYLRQSLDNVDQLCKMALAASGGQIILDPLIAGMILPEKHEPTFLKQLTDREFDIIKLLSQGDTNAAIAQELFIEVKTVEHHLNSIYSKIKSEADFEKKHPRVSAARMYLATVGELNSPVGENSPEGRMGNLVGVGRGRG